MAQAKPRAVIKLPAEVKTRLEDVKEDMERARHGIEVLKRLGMDTRELEEKLEWAEKARDTMLTEFG